MKNILLNQGQAGDLCINTVAAQIFKSKWPDEILVMSINKKWVDLAPLFYNHPYIDGIHVWEGYDNWPSEKDKDFIRNNFEKVRVASPMMPHTSNGWWKKFHQTTECVIMNGIKNESEMKDYSNGFSCYLEKWFDVEYYHKWVAFAPFAGWYNQNNDKMLTVEKANEIVGQILKLGYCVFQIGGPNEPQLNGTIRVNQSYFESVKMVLGCEALVHTDTGMGWYASAYSHPQLGLYSHAYYGEDRVRAIQPINRNGKFLSARNVGEIDVEMVVDSLKGVL